MRVLLGQLANFAWLLYAVCALGALFYAFRALSLQRRIQGSLTAFEKDLAVTQVVRLWGVAAAFVLVGVVLFIAQAYVLPQILPEELIPPTPTLEAGLLTGTPSPTPPVTPIMGDLPTVMATPGPDPAVTAPTAQAVPTGTATPQTAVPPTPYSARFGGVIELLGYELSSSQVAAGQPLGLTLYWRTPAGGVTSDYIVFTHLLPPDISFIIAQHDSQPAGGTRPTSTWSAGETILDCHQLNFLDTTYNGTAQIAVGLYDPLTQARLPLDSGGDYVLLPVSLTVAGP